MTEALRDLGNVVTERLGIPISDGRIDRGELTISIEHGRLIEAMTFLRDGDRCRFICLIDICGVDNPDREQRFDVVYHLLSPKHNQRIRVKCQTDDAIPVPSIAGLFPAANWFEREAFDMYGILFSDHPDLRRLLTDYGFEGYPLRKDFPLTGYVEVRYDNEAQKVVYEPVKLQQEYRSFDFLSPWEGLDRLLPGDEKASAGEDKPKP